MQVSGFGYYHVKHITSHGICKVAIYCLASAKLFITWMNFGVHHWRSPFQCFCTFPFFSAPILTRAFLRKYKHDKALRCDILKVPAGLTACHQEEIKWNRTLLNFVMRIGCRVLLWFSSESTNEKALAGASVSEAIKNGKNNHKKFVANSSLKWECDIPVNFFLFFWGIEKVSLNCYVSTN